MTASQITTIGACPECDADVHIEQPLQLGLRVACCACNTMLEVIGLTPIELDWAFEEPLGRRYVHVAPAFRQASEPTLVDNLPAQSSEDLSNYTYVST